MKLASLKSANSRDGELIVVNKKLTKATKATGIVKNLQTAIENWQDISPLLQQIYDKLNQNLIKDAFCFEPALVESPLPRSYQWVDGSAYVNHVELVRKARGAKMPDNFWTEPLVYQGGSDDFLAPMADIEVIDEAYGIDFEAEVAIITNDVAMGTNAHDASPHILLFMLVNDVSLRNLIPEEIAKGFGFYQSKPASSFSPVAVTADELEDSWDGRKLNLPLYSYLNGKLFGKPNAGVDMTFSFPELIAHTCKTRNLRAGTIVGSGTVSNLDRTLGSSCIAEKRMLEIIAHKQAKTEFMKFGDTIKIEMLDKNQQNIFGSIYQTVKRKKHDKTL